MKRGGGDNKVFVIVIIIVLCRVSWLMVVLGGQGVNKLLLLSVTTTPCVRFESSILYMENWGNEA